MLPAILTHFDIFTTCIFSGYIVVKKWIQRYWTETTGNIYILHFLNNLSLCYNFLQWICCLPFWPILTLLPFKTATLNEWRRWAFISFLFSFCFNLQKYLCLGLNWRTWNHTPFVMMTSQLQLPYTNETSETPRAVFTNIDSYS